MNSVLTPHRCQDITHLACSSGLWEHISHLWYIDFLLKTSHFFQRLSGGPRGETINLRNMQPSGLLEPASIVKDFSQECKVGLNISGQSSYFSCFHTPEPSAWRQSCRSGNGAQLTCAAARSALVCQWFRDGGCLWYSYSATLPY